MDLIHALHTSEPRITRGSREALYCWPGTLAVIVRKDRSLGQFATSGQWSHADVADAMAGYLRKAASPRDA